MENDNNGCQYRKDFFDEKTCGNKLYDDKYCIFHSKDIERKKDAMFEELKYYIDNTETDRFNNYFDFNGFVFNSFPYNKYTFKKPVDFRNAVFKEKVDFSEFTFNKKVDFSHCFFEKAESDNKNEIPLSDVVYYFRETTFNDDAIFMQTYFGGKVRFDHAKFYGKTDFRQSCCQKHAAFVMCEFHGDADFSSRVFLGNALFSDNQFLNNVSFDNASFENVEFEYDCGLVRNKFYKNASFYNTKFMDKVSFNSSIFYESCHFVGSRGEKDNLVFSCCKKPNDLSDIVFAQPEKVIFNLVDLSNCIFDNTNLTKVNLTNIKWKERDDRNCIYSTDETKKKSKKSKKLKKSAKSKQTEQYYLWERTSQQLKYSYNLVREDELAGDFHYWELYFRKKRLLSRGKITDYFYWSMIVLYDKLFAFGESFIRPAAVFLFVLFLFTIGYCIWGECCGVTSKGHQVDMDLWKAITMSLKGSFRDKIRINSGAFELVSIVNTIVNIVFTALIVMAVRRKLKR